MRRHPIAEGQLRGATECGGCRERMDPSAQPVGRQGAIQERLFRRQFAGRPWQTSMAQPRRGELPPTTSRCFATVQFRRLLDSQTHCPLLQEARARAAASQFSRLATRGPSTDFLKGTLSIENIQRRGRWKSLSSVRRYEKHGRLSAQLRRLTDSQKRVASLASVALPGRLLRAFG